jgi:hypothetical protein
MADEATSLRHAIFCFTDVIGVCFSRATTDIVATMGKETTVIQYQQLNNNSDTCVGRLEIDRQGGCSLYYSQSMNTMMKSVAILALFAAAASAFSPLYVPTTVSVHE